MMNYDCEIIQDLLPLYQEELCSGASRQAVESHLRECERCRRLAAPLPIPEPEESPAADRAVRKSMRKVKRRWLASLLAAVMTVPMLLLCFNQYRGCGICFTNMDDIYTAWRFLHALENRDWEKAAKMHDFSADYESILEALGQDAAYWGSSFTPCSLAGYDYAASGYLERTGQIPTTAQELYGYLYNRTGTAMVPLALWEQLMTVDPTAFEVLGRDYVLNGERYGRVTTPWGEYVVSEGRSYDTAYDYATYFDLIPYAVYEAARPMLEAEAQQLYTTTHRDIGWVAELTEAEFTAEMIRRYTADLTELENTVSFACTGYRSISRYCDDPDAWCVFFATTITQSGNGLDTDLQINVADGKIEVAGISHQGDVQSLDTIARALYPSAHAGY